MRCATLGVYIILMYIMCMKRINIILSDELASRLEKLSMKKEMSVAEITRRSLEIYMQRFPETPHAPAPVPVFDFGKVRKRDLRKSVYDRRVKEILD
jgi:hypothetical protein